MNFCNRVLQGRKASPMQECKSFSLVEVEKFMTLWALVPHRASVLGSKDLSVANGIKAVSYSLVGPHVSWAMPERGAIWVGMWWNLTLTGDGVYFCNLTRHCFCLIFIDFGDKCWIYSIRCLTAWVLWLKLLFS